MSILILGATGFIGNACFRFFSKGHETIGIDYRSDVAEAVISDLDFSLTKKYIKDQKPHLIINCAGSSNIQQSFSDPKRDHELNTLLVEKLLNEIKEHSPNSKFINLSSAAVYGNPKNLPIKETDLTQPLSPYGQHKLQSEQLLTDYARNYGLKTLSVRIFSAYGIGLKRQFFYDLSVKFHSHPEGVMLYGTGEESRDFIYISDIVSSFDLLNIKAAFEGEIFNLAGGKEVKIKVLAEKFAEKYGYKGKINFNGEQLQGYPLNWEADISKIRALGYVENIALEQGMKLYADWVKQNLSA